MGDLERQPGLADSAWTGQGDQPDSALRHARGEVGYVRFPANQPSGQCGKHPPPDYRAASLLRSNRSSRSVVSSGRAAAMSDARSAAASPSPSASMRMVSGLGANAETTLEIADRAGAQPRSLCQLFLAESSQEPKAPNERGERLWLCLRHRTSPDFGPVRRVFDSHRSTCRSPVDPSVRDLCAIRVESHGRQRQYRDRPKEIGPDGIVR